jgi:prophage regulatory protein
MAAGTFPRPIALGPGAVAWRESEINDWIAARILGATEVEAR